VSLCFDFCEAKLFFTHIWYIYAYTHIHMHAYILHIHIYNACIFKFQYFPLFLLTVYYFGVFAPGLFSSIWKNFGWKYNKYWKKSNIENFVTLKHIVFGYKIFDKDYFDFNYFFAILGFSIYKAYYVSVVTFLLQRPKLLMKYFILIFSYIIKILSNNII
jgi:hypothetical protein